MTEQGRLADASKFYLEAQLAIDRRLIEARYECDREHFVGQSALELGPADGVMTALLLRDFKQLTVVDGSAELLARIPEHPRLTKVCTLFETFRPNQSFDTVVLEHILEHVEDPVALLAAVKKHVAPGGVLIAGVPNANSVHRLAAVKMGLLAHADGLNERDLLVGHRRVYTLSLLVEHFARAGLPVDKTGGLFLKPLSNQQIEAQWSDEMVRAFFALGRDLPELAAEIYAVARL